MDLHKSNYLTPLALHMYKSCLRTHTCRVVIVHSSIRWTRTHEFPLHVDTRGISRTVAIVHSTLVDIWNAKMKPKVKLHWEEMVIDMQCYSRLAPSQWETSLQSNAVSHWLGANLESALMCSVTARCEPGCELNVCVEAWHHGVN